MNVQKAASMAAMLVFACCAAAAQENGESGTSERQGALSGLDAGQQRRLLEVARRELAREQAEMARLEQLFETQAAQIEAAAAAFDERQSGLKELFAVLQVAVADTEIQFGSSLTRLQFPDRGAFLVELGEKIASPTALAPIDDIEHFVYELQREIVESGKIVRFEATVTKVNGEQSEESVVRVGVFNVVSDAGYLQLGEDGVLEELEHQPGTRHTGSASALANATDGVVMFALDPSRGAILGLLSELGKDDSSGVFYRSVSDRPALYWPILAYAVVALGLLGLIIAITRWSTGKNR